MTFRNSTEIRSNWLGPSSDSSQMVQGINSVKNQTQSRILDTLRGHCATSHCGTGSPLHYHILYSFIIPSRISAATDVFTGYSSQCLHWYQKIYVVAIKDQYTRVFGKKSAEETEEEKNKRWGTFNDTLRKMVLGTYICAKLPSYFRSEFDLIERPQWKSFFHSACPGFP